MRGKVTLSVDQVALSEGCCLAESTSRTKHPLNLDFGPVIRLAAGVSINSMSFDHNLRPEII